MEEEEDGEDPRWELIRQLVEYKKFKDAAAQLQILGRFGRTTSTVAKRRKPVFEAANRKSRTFPFST